MTREVMLKTKFKVYHEITFISPRTKKEFDCMMIGVNFDLEQFLLMPFETEIIDDEFWVGI